VIEPLYQIFGKINKKSKQKMNSKDFK